MTAEDFIFQPEIRTDVLTGRRVIVAASRSGRPNGSLREPELVCSDDPFAEGAEQQTPGEWLSLRDRNSVRNRPGWLVRVVPNRFPAAQSVSQPKGSPKSPGHPEEQTDGIRVAVPSQKLLAASSVVEGEMLPRTTAEGVHDVVIECPDGRSRLVDLSVAEITTVLRAWQRRLQQLKRSTHICHAAIFRNEGFSAGASLPHCHSQILGFHFDAPLINERVSLAEQHFQRTGASLTEDWLKAEIHDGRRILHSEGPLTVLCPFASRTSWQTRIVPSAALPTQFDMVEDSDIRDVAKLLSMVLQTTEACVGRFSFNLALHLAPLRTTTTLRWMLDICPRTSRSAGWELLTDIDIISTPPEHSAARLREAWPTVVPRQPLSSCTDDPETPIWSEEECTE